MRIGRVIGRVTLSRQYPALRGGRFLIALPCGRDRLLGGSRGSDPVVVIDFLGAAEGALVSFVEGREAACPFGATLTPIDAYCSAILDRVEYAPAAAPGTVSGGAA